MNSSNEPLGGPLLIFAIGILFSTLWSSAFIVGKIGLESSPPLYLLSFRFFLAGILMTLITAAFTDWRPRGQNAWRAWLFALVLGLLNNVLYLGAGFYAMLTLPAGLVILILSAAPVITTALAYVALGEPLSIRKGAGILISLQGIVIIVYPKIDGNDLSELFGVALVCTSTIAFAAGTVFYKRYAAHIPMLWINAWSTFFASLVLFPVALAFEEMSAITWNSALIGTIAYLVLIVSIGAMLLWFWLIRLIDASKASMIHLMNPLLGLFLAWQLLDEIPDQNELLGALPIVAGVLLVLRDK